MRHPNYLAALTALALCPGLAQAQADLGELRDRGARKLAKQELVRLLNDATARGLNATDAEVSIDYRADGSVIGALLSRKGGEAGTPTGIYGSWDVADNGKLCVNATRVGAGQSDMTCGFYFRLGGAYFVSPSDSDPKAQVLKRVVERR